MAGKKISKYALASSVSFSDVVIGNFGGSTKKATVQSFVSKLVDVTFKGPATPSTDPGTPTGTERWTPVTLNVAYPNFGNLTPTKVISDFLWNGTAWVLVERDADLTGYIPEANIVDDLTTGGTLKPLSAEQGKVLNKSFANLSDKDGVEADGNLVDINDPDYTSGYFVINGALQPSTSWNSTGYTRVKPNTTYTPNYKNFVSFFDADQNYISQAISERADLFFTTPSGTAFVRFGVPIIEPKLIKGAFATFPDTVEDFHYVLDKTANDVPVYANNITPALRAELESESLAASMEYISLLRSGIASLDKQIDVLTDDKNPLFINQALICKIDAAPAAPKQIAIVSRINDHSFEVDPADISDWANTTDRDKTFAIVMPDGSEYVLLGAKCPSKAAGIINTIEVLPATLTVFEVAMDGIHMGRMMHKYHAQYIAKQIERYAYQKSLYYAFISQECKSGAASEALNITTNEVVANFIKTAGSVSGGWLVDGIYPNRVGIGDNQSNNYGESIYKNAYIIAQNGIGRGATLSIPVGIEGFVRIVVGEHILYNAGALNVVVTDQENTVLYSQSLRGIVREIIVPLQVTSTTINLSFTCAANVNTVWGISEILIYKKREALNYPILQKPNLKIAFLCDSWGEFPLNITGDTPKLRADGSTSAGQMYMSEYLKTYLASKGYTVTTYNNSRGGQTSAWGKYYLKKLILDLTSKPDYCVINFGINDGFSALNGYADSGADSVYDFDPVSPMVSKFQSAGGVKGATTIGDWISNMKYISQTLLKNGIKPIILMPPPFYTLFDYSIKYLREDFNS